MINTNNKKRIKILTIKTLIIKNEKNKTLIKNTYSKKHFFLKVDKV